MNALLAIISVAALGETYDFSDSRKIIKSAEAELVAFWRAERNEQHFPGDPNSPPPEDVSRIWAAKREEAQAACPLLSHTLLLRAHFERHATDEQGTTYIVARLAGNLDTHVTWHEDASQKLQTTTAIRSQSTGGADPAKRKKAAARTAAKAEREYLERAKAVEHYLWIEMPQDYTPPVRPARRFEALVLVGAVEYSVPPGNWLQITGEAQPQEFPYLVIRGALVRSDDLGWSANGAIKK